MLINGLKKISKVNNLILLLILLMTLIIFFLLLSASFSTIVDDAYITFRYSKNLINGYGLSYNPGVKVEGTSSLLWSLILAPFLLLHLPITLTAKIISLIGTLIIIPLLFYKFLKNKYLAVVAIILFWTNTNVIHWSTLGLETIFYATLIFITFVFVDQRWWRRKGGLYLLFFIGLAISLTRPEGILYLIAIVLYLFFNEKFDRKKIIYLWLSWLLFLVALSIFRYFYFGNILPNTFWAKNFGITFADKIIRGCYYVKKWLWDFPYLTILFLFGLWTIRKTKTVFLVLTFLIAQGIFVVASAGSDWMPDYRHIIPALPIIIALNAMGLWQIIQLLNKSSVSPLISNLLLLFLALIIVIWQIHSFYSVDHSSTWREDYCNKEGGVTLGKWINQHAKPNAKIAARDIGALGFYSERYIIDLVGLTDEHIAKTSGYYSREKLDVNYVFAQNPDYIVIDGISSNPANPVPQDVTRTIYTDKRFQTYKYVLSSKCYDNYFYNLFEKINP
jgi:arabinofuranosyltransferase